MVENKTADLLLENKFYFNDQFDLERDPRIVDNPNLDWSLMPFGDNEWTFMLNRMDYLRTLHNRSETHNQKLKQFVFNWIDNIDLSEGFIRTIDTAIRICAWVDVIDVFTDYERQIVIGSINHQIEYLEANWLDRHLLLNWGIIQSASIIYTYAKVPGIIADKEMHKSHLLTMINTQFTKSGMHNECSTMYLFEVIKQLNKISGIPGYQFIDATLINAKRTLVNLKLNSGYLAPIGDSDFHYANILFEYLKISDDLEPADNTSDGIVHVHTGNFEVMLFNMIHGGGHGHFMKNHIEVCYKDKQVFTDCGRFNYRNIKERYDLKSIVSHNTIHSDDMDIAVIDSWKNTGSVRSFPIEHYKTNNRNIIVSTWISGNVTHNRGLWIEDDFVVIIDMCGSDYQVNFNLNQGASYESDVITIDKTILNFKSTSLLETSVGTQSRKYNQLDQIQRVTCSNNEEEYVVNVLAKDEVELKVEPILNVKHLVVDGYRAIRVNNKTLIISFTENLGASIPYYYDEIPFNCRIAVVENGEIEVIKT